MKECNKIKSVKNDYLLKLFEKAVFVSNESQIKRIKNTPMKLFILKFLQFIAEYSGKLFKIKTKTFFADDMIIVIPEIVSLNIYRHGFFEKGLTQMILEHLKPGMTFLDIGSHFGYFTLLASIIVGSEGQVHSFEPTPSTFEIFKSNVLNKKNVVLNNYAVFSKKTNIFMNDYGIKYAAFNSIYNARLSKDVLRKLKKTKYEIKAVSVDDYVEDKGIMPNFIKIDAESAEYEILLGMEKTINKFHPMISVEVGDIGVKNVSTSRDLIVYLINKSYQPYECKDGKILQHDLKNATYQYDNILFLPK